MIIQEIYLPEYRWKAKVYYAVSSYYADEILKELLEYFKSKHYFAFQNSYMRPIDSFFRDLK